MLHLWGSPVLRQLTGAIICHSIAHKSPPAVFSTELDEKIADQSLPLSMHHDLQWIIDFEKFMAEKFPIRDQPVEGYV